MSSIKKFKPTDDPITDKLGVNLALDDIVIFIDNSLGSSGAPGSSLKIGKIMNIGMWKRPNRHDRCSIPAIQCEIIKMNKGDIVEKSKWHDGDKISSAVQAINSIKLTDSLISNVLTKRLMNI